MAEFEQAYNITMNIEGGYSNDTSDRGKETYKGISRKFHPDWAGWLIIDTAKNVRSFPYCLNEHVELQQLVKAFYKSEYWDKFRGDIVPQDIADELFDQCVNMGITTGCRNLQGALTALNRDKHYTDLKQDGVIGNASISALNEYLKHDKSELLVKMLNRIQGFSYYHLALTDASQRKYIRGWIART